MKTIISLLSLDNNHFVRIIRRDRRKKVFLKIFSKFKIEKAPNVLYRRGPRHFEVEQSAISLPLLGAYDQRICHLRAENEKLRAEKMENVKIINGQAAELAERRAEVFQLRQELQLLTNLRQT